MALVSQIKLDLELLPFSYNVDGGTLAENPEEKNNLAREDRVRNQCDMEGICTTVTNNEFSVPL